MFSVLRESWQAHTKLATTSTVCLIAATVILVAVSPGDDGSDTPAPVAKGATVVNVSVSPTPVALADYLVNRKTVSTAYDSGQLESKGWVVTYTIELEAFDNDACPLTWTLVNASTSAAVPDTFWLFRDVRGWPDGLLVGRESSEMFLGELWVPLPTSLGSFSLELNVCQTDEGPLAQVTTVPLTIGKGAR